MTGTEKQIKWAEEIKAEKTKINSTSARTLLMKLGKEAAAGLANPENITLAQEAMKEVLENCKESEKAQWWINNISCSMYDFWKLAQAGKLR